MKLLNKSAKPSGQRGNRKGVALVTVLAVMSLSTILILTFFSLAQSEHRASATYSHGLQAQQVGEQAINMVIAQIRKASASTTSAWASQPGAIRTWASDGNFEMGYKLYSDESMEMDDEKEFVQEDFDEAKDWSDQPEVYVDLNEPVVRGEKVYFPIVDPYSRETPTWPKKIGNQEKGIEGFDYNTGSGGNSNSKLVALGTNSGTPAKELADVVRTQTQRDVLPMPVKWIYQLRDGSLGHLAPSGAIDSPKKFIRLSGQGTPSEENRIVARFAFWADDETSKLNVNTAAGGLAWDIPKAGGDLDMAMGKFQPAQHEWQRYPGHPATTHLIPVLAPGVIDIVNDRDAMEMIFELVPRVVGGGSESGTVKIDPRDVELRLGLIADKNPLFPSVDEFMLRPDREPAAFPDSQGGVLPENEIQEHLERSKFFLTVTSRAPETTIFNTPRVTMWPIFNAPRSSTASSDYQQKLTNFDRLIHFCSTLGGESSAGSGSDRIDYIFRREDADSATHDYANIQRNQDLYAYLDGLMSEEIPGYGGSFHSKYGDQQSRQILTEIFDYIRCTNLHDDSLFGEDWQSAMTTTNSNQHRTFTNGRRDRVNRQVVGEDRMHKGHGQVTPISINLGTTPTKGFGRFFTLLNAEIVAICCGQAGPAESVGGVGVNPRYPGITKYGGGFFDQPINEPAWSNIPPLNTSVNVQYNSLDEAAKTAERTNWPGWLTAAYTANPADPLIANSAPGKGGVFDPAVWNWQLGWADSGYTNDQMGDRSSVDSDQMRLKPNQRLVQAGLFFHLFTPSLGWIPINPDMSIEVDVKSGITFDSVDGANSVSLEETKYTWYTNGRQIGWGDRHYGGTKPLSYQLGASTPDSGSQGVSYGGRWSPIDPGYDSQEEFNQYDLVTKPFVIDGDQLSMAGGDVQFKIRDANASKNQSSAPQDTVDDLVQDITIEFPPFSVDAPLLPAGRPGYYNEFDRIQRYPTSPLGMWSLTRHGTNPETVGGENSNDRNSARHGRFYRINNHEGAGRIIWGQDLVQEITVGHGDARIAAARPTISKSDQIYEPHWMYGNSRMAHSMGLSTGGTYSGYQFSQDRQIVQNVNYRGKNPVMISGQSHKNSTVMFYGDFDNGPGLTVDGPYINKPDEGNLHSLFNATDPDASAGQFEMRRDYGDFPYFVRDWIHEPASPAYFSPNRIINGPAMFGSLSTGSVENRPWQTLLFRPNVEDSNGFKSHPGAVTPPDHLLMDLFWMPIVEPYAISEPLSTAGKVNLNYQMLPFRHIERSTALRGVFKSEYMLCVPTPGSGASARSKYVGDYKHNSGRGRGYHWRDKPYGGNLQGLRLRTVILEDQTLAQFQKKFEDQDSPEIFKTASEVTTIHLVPQQVAERQGSTSRRAQILTYTPDENDGEIPDMDNGKYWAEHAVVGDNSRERPYGNIYNRVTTKSNTYKVHFRAQVLTQSRRADDDYTSWDPKIDSVVGEYRGATIVERYVESNDREIPDYATADPTQLPSLGEYYKFRVVNPTRFAP